MNLGGGGHPQIKLLRGFTMAEVLIILGIIGIIAAMTFPSLVAKHQKYITAISLKRTYNILQQAINRSVADHGEVGEWDLAGIRGYANISNTQRQELLEQFVSIYIVPYFSKLRDVEFTKFKNLGYEQILGIDGSPTPTMFDIGGEYLILTDGTIIGITIDNTGNQGTEENPIYVTTNLAFYVDINGKKNPNTIGKDIFVFILITDPEITSNRFRLYGCGYGSNRTTILELCRSSEGGGRYCGCLMMMDGWEIRDDYPW